MWVGCAGVGVGSGTVSRLNAMGESSGIRETSSLRVGDMSAEDREGILNEAAGYVTRDRNSSYGDPEDNFSNIAEVWNAQGMCMGGVNGVRPINATDVALLMVGMKLARLKHNPTHRDSWVDAAGYIACGYDVATTEEGSALGVTVAQLIAPEDLDADLNDMFSTKAEGINDVGWVSDNRCISPNPHEAHSYGQDYTRISGPPAHWCDGYVDAHKAKRESDLETVKRVADKHRTTTYPHGVIGPEDLPSKSKSTNGTFPG